MNWRPMETAPRDGRCIVLDYRGDPVVCQYDSEMHAWDGYRLLLGDHQVGGWLPISDDADLLKIGDGLLGGLTARDYFAGQALTLFLMNTPSLNSLEAGVPPRHDLVAQFCYGLADAMLKERGK